MRFGLHLFLQFLICSSVFCSSVYADTPYPPMGIPYSTGSMWGGSYHAGTLGNDLVQLDSLGRLPALDGSQLFNLPSSLVVYPPAGVPVSTGSGWTYSYGVGVNPGNLIALDSNARLPAGNGSQLTNLPSSMVSLQGFRALLGHPGAFPMR